MKKKILLLLIAVTGCCAVSSAQARKGLRINEVMVVNETNFVDDYGNRGAWIELFNSNYAPLEISSVFLTNDSLQPRLYPVPSARGVLGRQYAYTRHIPYEFCPGSHPEQLDWRV